MSDVVFKSKIPIPKYYVGNLQQAYVQGRQLALQQDQIDARRDALTYKKQAAQKEAVQKMQAERSKILGMLGGLYENAHTFAAPFMEEAFKKLEAEIMPLMYLPEGAEAAKLYINNFKQSAEKYALSEDMRKANANMTAMLDEKSPEWMSADKSLGPLYKPSVTPEALKAAEDYQYTGLLQDAKLEYSMGKFSIVGTQYDPTTGLGGEIKLENHPRFNDATVFSHSTVGVSGIDIPTLGQAIRTSEKASEKPWDWERITNNFQRWHSGTLPFDDLDRESNEAYQFRYQVYKLGGQDIREAAGAMTPRDEEALLDIYSLDPKYKETNPTVYNLVQEQLKSYWNTEAKPHTMYDTDTDVEKGLAEFLGSSEMTSLSTAELPKRLFDPATDAPETPLDTVDFLAVPEEVVDGTREMKTASYATQALPSKMMENIDIPVINPEYYDQMKIYEAAQLLTFDPFGNPMPNPAMMRDPRMAEAVIPLLEKEDLIQNRKLNSLVAYEGNPNVVGIYAGNSLELINLSDMSQRHAVIMGNVNTALSKIGYKWENIYNHALENHFNGATSGPVTFD